MHKLLAIAVRLDALRAERRPSTADAEALIAAWRTGAAAVYFFREDYSDPGWLLPLREVGTFRKFSKVRSAKRRRWVIFRELSAYLHRVAEAEPKQVAEILASLSTTDQWATGQLMKATLALPDEHAAKVIPQFVKWCRPDNPFAREEEVIELTQRMLKSGYESEFALLLTLLLKPWLSREGQDVSGAFFEDELVDFARGQFQSFCQAAPVTSLRVAERCLRTAVRLRARAEAARWKSVGMERGAKPDPSAGIRAAIEEHRQNQFPDFEDGLVVAVRDALAAYVTESPSKAERIVRKYLRSRWSIFRRLAIHTLTENAGTYSKLAQAAALRRRFFEDAELYHEYWRLVPAVFNDLTSDQQEQLLGWIDAAYPGADERDKQWFAYPRLTMLGECDLPPAALRTLQELQAQLPEDEHPDFLVYSESWAGAVKRELPADLEGKTIDELWRFLDTWQPDPSKPRPFGPSYSTVGQELRRIVKADLPKYQELVERMASHVMTWMADDAERKWATYVGYVLDGYGQACREGQQFDWSRVLALADAVVPTRISPIQWPDSEPPKEGVPQLGYDWCGVRHEVANLIEGGLSTDGPARIPDRKLPRVRDILILLTRDPSPTPEYEHEHERKNADTPNTAPVDWHHVAINTNRPEAANVLLRYAVRHANPIVREQRDEPRMEQNVRHALSALADDPCRSVHSMLGSWLGVLWWLDNDWLKGLLGSILPLRPEQSDLWQAAWRAFVQYGVIYPKLHEHLIPHYQRSINECAAREEDDPHLKGLCKHLVAIYTWGWEEYRDTNSLISRFYEVAREDAASELAEALGHFARNLDEAEDDASNYWRRIEDLVRRRLEEIRPKAEDHVKELRGFAAWLDAFISRSRHDLADIADVLDVMTAVPLTHWQFERVVEFLDAQADAYPGIAARLLRQMLSKCDRDAWYWERDKINLVLEKVFASDNAEAHQDAVKIIELLWEQGEWEPFERHREKIEQSVSADSS